MTSGGRAAGSTASLCMGLFWKVGWMGEFKAAERNCCPHNTLLFPQNTIYNLRLSFFPLLFFSHKNIYIS